MYQRMAMRRLSHYKLMSCLIGDLKETRLAHRGARSNCGASSEDVKLPKVSCDENGVVLERKNEGQMSYLEARQLLQSKRSLSPTVRLKEMFDEDFDGDTSLRNDCSGTESEVQTAARCDLTSSRAYDDDVTGLDLEATGKGDVPLADGELVIAVRENVKRHDYFCRLVLLGASKTFCCKYGAISHSDIIGNAAGTTFITDLGIGVMFRKPSLEEFVLYMRRLPVISYPKDCCSMLMMIDASPGDVILEAGTGSGAMTLFLSRAVGTTGCIHTFEVRPDHQKRAEKNMKQWATSWNVGHPLQHWPDNVVFHSGNVQECVQTLSPGLLVDGAVIDMERPYEATPVLAARLKSGRAAVLYVANITQIIELAEFLRVHDLPLTIEKTLEVTHREWLLNQARRHSGRVLNDEASLASESVEMLSGQRGEGAGHSPFQYIKDHIPKYVARPRNSQPGHTAFLVKLRKITNNSVVYKI